MIHFPIVIEENIATSGNVQRRDVFKLAKLFMLIQRRMLLVEFLDANLSLKIFKSFLKFKQLFR